LICLLCNEILQGPPDFQHCVVQQKLQLLSCCIEKKAVGRCAKDEDALNSMTFSPSVKRVSSFRKKVRQLVTGSEDTGVRQQLANQFQDAVWAATSGGMVGIGFEDDEDEWHDAHDDDGDGTRARAITPDTMVPTCPSPHKPGNSPFLFFPAVFHMQSPPLSPTHTHLQMVLFCLLGPAHKRGETVLAFTNLSRPLWRRTTTLSSASPLVSYGS
jgi:hypothetical protein